MNHTQFPTHILPKVITNFIAEIEKTNGFDKAYMSGAYLAILSTIMGTNYKVSINDRWSIYPTMWISLTGDSGTKKTPSVKPLTDILKRVNDLKYSEYLNQKEQNNDDENTVPPNQILADDATYEGLTEIMEHNKTGILLLVDELHKMIEDGSQISKSLTKLLSVFDSEPIMINRKTKGEYIKIDNPFMSILGGIQTKLFDDLLLGGRLDNGFIFRFLFILESKERNLGSLENPDRDIETEFENFIKKLMAIRSNKTDKVKQIKMSDGAKKKFMGWRVLNYHKMENTNENTKKGYLSKMEAYVPKFALLLEFSDSISSNKSISVISDYSIERAIELSDYFIYNFFTLINSTQNKRAKEKANEEIRKKCVDKAISKLPTKDKKAICKELSNDGVKNCDIEKSLFISKGGVSQYINK
jgi:hypothetical protein